MPGFYDDVLELTEAEHAAMAALPFDEEAFRVATGVPALVGEAGYSTLERKATRPTLDVNGIWGGFQGAGSKTIIPAHAHAKVSCRLVADQDPARHLRPAPRLRPGHRPARRDGHRPGPRRRPAEPDPDRPPGDRRPRRAPSRRVFGRAPLFTREGGSIPVTADFASVLGLPVVLLGFVQPHDNAHAPNEWMDLANYEGAIRAIVATFDEIAALPR